MPMSLGRRLAALGSLVLSVLAIAPAPAAEDFTLTRIAGEDRYATAAAAALDAFASPESVVVARGDAFPDALAGAYLTGVLDAPLLLTRPDALPVVTSDAIAALGATKIYLLGGTTAISDDVADEAAGEGREVVRVAGSSRYATAARIATGQDAAGIGEISGKRAAILASGDAFADALAAGPVAHAAHVPVLLTSPASLPAETVDAVDSLGIEHVVVVGGTAAVSEAVVDAVESRGVTTQRVGGANRYDTAARVADFALDAFETMVDDRIDIATGERFADALAAGPAAGERGNPVLLTASASLSGEARGWLEGHAGTLLDGRVFGGTAAVADATVQEAEAAASGAMTGPQTGQVTFADPAANTYRFVADGAEVSSSVTYADGDTFRVDGAAATIGGFESAVTPADRVRHVPAAGSTAARHELTNVAASSITSGTIGNIDIANGQLDFVNRVNGDAIRSDVPFAGATWSVDGGVGNQDAFEAAINEGDALTITGSGATARFALTNGSVAGAVSDIAPGALPVLPVTQLRVDALGDDPADDANDDRYQADGDPSATDTFSVDGLSDSTYDDFAAALTDGDVVTYARADGVEHFALVDRAPRLIEGGAVDGIDPAGGPLPTDAGGGSFSVVTDGGPVEVTYVASGTFVVDGSVASETELEAAYTAGDAVTFRAADAPSGTPQRLELTNRTLQGPVGKDSVTTEDTVLPTMGTANSYGVLGQDGTTILRQVEYVSANASANTYVLDGTATTLARFEQELDAIKAGTRTATVVVDTTGTGESAVTQHRLTSTAS